MLTGVKRKAGSVALAVGVYAVLRVVGIIVFADASIDFVGVHHPAFFGAFQNKSTHIVNRNILVGDRLYRIMATMPVRAADTERAYVEKFFAGFELRAPGGS